MLEILLDLKGAYWGLDSEEYFEFKGYFLSLSSEELKIEYDEHFPGK